MGERNIIKRFDLFFITDTFWIPLEENAHSINKAYPQERYMEKEAIHIAHMNQKPIKIARRICPITYSLFKKSS